MIKINPMPAQVDPQLLRTLSGLDPADIGHVRHYGVIGGFVSTLAAGRVVGTAVTVIAPAFDAALIPHVLGLVRPGDFLIIDRLGDRHYACVGDVVALAAQVAGLSGIAIDGLAGDLAGIRALEFPLWCRGESVQLSRALGVAGAINVPVVCGGMAVTPGDAVLASPEGLVILPADEIEAMARHARPMTENRPARIQRIKSGEKLGVINGATERIERRLEQQKRE